MPTPMDIRCAAIISTDSSLAQASALSSPHSYESGRELNEVACHNWVRSQYDTSIEFANNVVTPYFDIVL